ncbi:MAG: acyl-CoA thioesterase II [Pseudomonadota bacterium]
MSIAIENLLNLLNLETLEHNLFRGNSPQEGWQRVFGGQVIAQALVAATRTIEDRMVHSLHGYFLQAGDPKVPIIYEVERIRDGKSFSTRRVVAIQHGRAIFFLSASFHKHEPGLTHQIEMPDVPQPETLPSEEDLKKQFINTLPANIKAYWERERPIEMRFVDFSRYLGDKPRDPKQYIWIKATGKMPDDQALHNCVLAYASDFSLLDTSLIAHGRTLFDPTLMMASLDHALWFHRPFRADQWLLYAQDSPSSSGARGFSRGSIFDSEGNLIASVAQEGLIREKAQE